MRFVLALGCLALLGACDSVKEAAGMSAADAGSSGRLSANSEQAMTFDGEFAINGKTWTPNECVKAEVEGMTGMIFLNEQEGFALAVWTEGVPEGSSNVWIADMNAPPPPDDDFSAGDGRCGKLKSKDGDLIAGASKVNCGDQAGGELRFRNCPDATSGSSAASVKSWPPK